MPAGPEKMRWNSDASSAVGSDGVIRGWSTP